MPRTPRVSPDRILAAAALEFAERGFAGARVDRIARRARVNKAMLYYHFQSKDRLYRTLLRRLFTLAAERMHAIETADLPPAEKIDRVIAGMAAFIDEHAFFPAIMLREVAEGGTHLDRDTMTALAAVPRAVGAIVQQGVASGAFHPVNPLYAYFSMLAPILFFLAGSRIRKDVEPLVVKGRAQPTPDFVAYQQRAVRRVLSSAPDAPARPRP
jgi:TetR/AcrR family transcriptional regulator